MGVSRNQGHILGMNNETKALKITLALLLAVSIGRWLLDPPPAVVNAGEPVDSDQLLEASVKELEEAEARSRPLKEGERIDPNRASEVELDRLPGVGEVTAKRIVEEREAEGPFTNVEDLARVSGIGTKTVARLASFLNLENPPPVPAVHPLPGFPLLQSENSDRSGLIDLNHASAEELEELPGIGPSLAEKILAARAEQPFGNLSDLERVSGIGSRTLERLRPFAKVTPR